MASASASATGTSDDDAGGQVIHGIDPGPVNCGYCRIRVTEAGHRVEALERISFRQSGADTSDYGTSVIDGVTKWISDNSDRFAHGEIIFIENQRPDAGMNTRGARFGQANDFVRTEALAVQHAFMTIFGGNRCIVVAPHAVKARYSKYFPRVPDYQTAKGRAAQYRADKKNAIIHGRSKAPKHVRKRYERANPKKLDDAYDAYWIAKYGVDFFLDAAGGVRSKPLKSKRRSNPERPRTAGAKRTAPDDDQQQQQRPAKSSRKKR